jgi:hypothetical protein
MSTRRSRPPRSRKVRASEPPPETDLASIAAATAPVIVHARQTDPSQTAELRALEAGWDELLS